MGGGEEAFIVADVESDGAPDSNLECTRANPVSS